MKIIGIIFFYFWLSLLPSIQLIPWPLFLVNIYIVNHFLNALFKSYSLSKNLMLN